MSHRGPNEFDGTATTTPAEVFAGHAGGVVLVNEGDTNTLEFRVEWTRRKYGADEWARLSPGRDTQLVGGFDRIRKIVVRAPDGDTAYSGHINAS